MNQDDHRERFDSVATEYHSDKYPGRYNCLMFVLDYLNPQKSDIVLDVGCGPGDQLVELSPSIKFGYGIDLSKEMIKVANDRSENIDNLKFIVSSSDSLPDELTNAGITKIYSNYALHHLPDDLKYESIVSLSKLLEPGGKLIIGDLMFSENPRNYSNLYEYAGYGPASDTPSTVPNLIAMFENAGFKHTVRLLNPITGIIIGEK